MAKIPLIHKVLNPILTPIIQSALQKVHEARIKILMGNLELLSAEKRVDFTDEQLRIISDADAKTSEEILKRFQNIVS